MSRLSWLPNELNFRFLFYLPLEDLEQACFSTPEFQSVCSDSYFWENRFRQENLPLLEEGGNAEEWLDIYRQSLYAAEQADQRLERVIAQPSPIAIISIALKDINDPTVFTSGPVSEEALLLLIEENRNTPQDDLVKRTTRLFLHSDKGMFKYQVKRLERAQKVREKNTLLLEAILTPEEVWFLFYKRAYFRQGHMSS